MRKTLKINRYYPWYPCGRWPFSYLLLLSLLTFASTASADVYLEDNSGGQGLVSIEAEDYHANVSQGGHDWQFTAPGGQSGAGALVAAPDNGANINTGYVTNSPRLDYQIEFSQTGTHYVWILGKGPDGDGDSLHVGLDGVALASSDRISSFAADWSWSNATMDGPVASFNVSSTGMHTVNVWMREDGFRFDKLVITTDPGYVPSGQGPAESPQGIPTLAAPAISPDGGNFSGSVTVTLAAQPAEASIYYTLDGSDPGGSGTLLSTGSLVLTQDATLKAIASLPGYNDSTVAMADFLVTTSSGGPTAYIQDTGLEGLVSIEAEDYHANVSQGGHDWQFTAPGGQSGAGALVAAPDNGANINTGYVTNSPRLDYQIEFSQTGTHYVWILGKGPDGDGDSLHVGLDGVALASSDRISSFAADWSWSNATMDGPVASFNVSSTGMHTVNVWMREDGFRFDKLVITTDPGYVPSGQGPAESPQGIPTLAAPVISPGGMNIINSVTVTLAAQPAEASIYYTLDGSDPGGSGTLLYTGPLVLTQATTLKAVASLTGYNDSAVAVEDFTQNACTPIRVMPLGDSITVGENGPKDVPPPGYVIGYRQRLYERLTNAGYVIDFVGSQAEGDLAIPAFDTDHEGHSGYSDTQVIDNLDNWLTTNPPDVILLHIGTNGLEVDAADEETILNIIDNHDINTIVVLAKIINRQTYSSTTSQYNANLEQMALDRISLGDNIVIVDMENALNYPDDLYSELHPNSTGYEKMAETWFNALTSFLPPPACGP